MRSGKHTYVLMCSPEGKAAMKCRMAQRAAKQEQQTVLLLKMKKSKANSFSQNPEINLYLVEDFVPLLVQTDDQPFPKTWNFLISWFFLGQQFVVCWGWLSWEWLDSEKKDMPHS